MLRYVFLLGVGYIMECYIKQSLFGGIGRGVEKGVEVVKEAGGRELESVRGQFFL